ncbi:MAG: 3-phosphoshikimate 1-carboxyvinyltransferase [Nannocystaceae bacterium]
MDTIEIQPLVRPPDATLTLPGSKSYTNRAFIVAALASGPTTLAQALFSDDTRYMAQALRDLGISVTEDETARSMVVHGCDGTIPSASATVNIGNAGTAARFLPPMMALGKGQYEVDGAPRMRERPIAPLVHALRQLGVRIDCLGEPDHIPLRIHANGLRGGSLRIRGDLSSQYISGLLLSAPYMTSGLTLELEGPLVSRPYVAMTRQIMRDFGVESGFHDDTRFHVAADQHYRGHTYTIEPDASAASYFFAAAAVSGGRVRVGALGTRSLQGDLDLVHILARMGCEVTQGEDWTELQGPQAGSLSGVEVDMRDLSDVAQTLAVVATFASSPTRITGIGFIRGKETDRINATVRELNHLGIAAEAQTDGMLVRPGIPHPGEVHTYEDHRMAMSFAVLGLLHPGIRIRDPGCTSKTFPNYFDALSRL